jgi:multidrug efflux pump
MYSSSWYQRDWVLSATITLPKENFPDIAQKKGVCHYSAWAGQSPQNTLRTLVTSQIEKQLKSLKGLKKVTSNSVTKRIASSLAEFQADVLILRMPRSTCKGSS